MEKKDFIKWIYYYYINNVLRFSLLNESKDLLVNILTNVLRKCLFMQRYSFYENIERIQWNVSKKVAFCRRHFNDSE